MGWQMLPALFLNVIGDFCMIPFDSSFFEKEERCGFVVDETMKTCWAAEMEVLFAIDCVCEKYDIPYFVFFGSLLGAIRHEGFIPWDDDMDIALKRDDYERLMSVLKDELPEGFEVINPLKDDYVTEYWGCVKNSSSVSIDPERLEKYHGCPFSVGVDVFQLDYLPKDPKKAEEHIKLFKTVWTTTRLAKKEDKTEKENGQLKTLLDGLEDIFDKKYKVRFDRKDSRKMIAQLVQLTNKIAASVRPEDSEELVSFIGFIDHPEKRFPKRLLEEIEWKPFENIFVPVPAGWDEALRIQYGDYMEIKKFVASHDYPIYKKQVELVREAYEKMMEQYGDKE